MEYWLPDAEEATTTAVKTNSIQIVDTPSDQVDVAEVNTIEATNAVKRPRTDDPEEDDSVRNSTRSTRQETTIQPPEKQPAKTKAPAEKIPMEEQKDRVRRKIISDVMARKIGVAMSDLLLLDSPIGNAIAEECRDLVDGVEATLWEEGRGPVIDVDESIKSNPVILETSEGCDRALEMYRRAAEGCGFSVSTIQINEEGTPRPLDRRVNLVSLDGRTPAPSQELPKLMVKLGNPENRPVEAMVDTGSEVNIIQASLAKQFELKVEGARIKTKSYSHDEVYLEGTTTVNLYIGNVWVKQQVYVVNTSVTQPFILGMPFVRAARVSFEYSPDGQMVLSCLLGTTRVRSPVAGTIKWSTDTTWDSLKAGLSRPARTTAITIDYECLPSDEPSEEEPEEHPILRLEGLDSSDQVVQLGHSEGMTLLSDLTITVAQEQKWATLRKLRESDDEQPPFFVNTLYKRKGVKVHPRDDIPSDGTIPEGDVNWKRTKWPEVQGLMDSSTPFSDWITPKFSLIEKGSRIYGDRLQGLLDQVEGHLTQQEIELFLQIMYNREAALSWDFEESGKVDPMIAPPQVIKVIDHKA
ncbi:Fc.00g073230.m01.CDS01 [Cosmosporella sp. VM-42]